MRMAKPYITALVIALLTTVAISWLPHSGKSPGKNKGEIAVFYPAAAKRLNNGNLVDVMIGLQLTGHLTKVEWNHAILSVDLKVSSDYEQPQRWFTDIEKLIRLSFVQMENVNRVLIRYVINGDEAQSNKLLFASDIRRTDSWLVDQLEELSEADPIHDEQWRNRLRISFTNEWEKRFGPADVYSAVPLKSQ